MNIFNRIFINAIIAGVFIGLLLSLLQTIIVYPLIAESEKYETLSQLEQEFDGFHSDDFNTEEVTAKERLDLESEQQIEWFPEDGFERTFYTTLSNVFLSIAFSLLINIGFTFYPVKHWSHGIYWGVAGLLTFYLIPTMVYSPVVPGTIEADHFARQLWWIATVESCAFGIAIAVFIKHRFIKLLGLFLIVIVVLIGAPPGEFHAHAPEDLVRLFFHYNIVIYSFSWIIQGLLLAYLFQKFQFSATIDTVNV